MMIKVVLLTQVTITEAGVEVFVAMNVGRRRYCYQHSRKSRKESLSLAMYVRPSCLGCLLLKTRSPFRRIYV